MGHIVFVKTLAGCFGPASVATDAIFYVFFAQIYDLDPGTGISHTVYKLTKQ
jgi:hypothetical protein